MRLLTLQIHEPLPGRVLPLMAEQHGHDEAARRYRAIVLMMIADCPRPWKTIRPSRHLVLENRANFKVHAGILNASFEP